MRLSWDEYFLKLAVLVSERATCPRLHCGCVLVKDKNIIATGYNGSIPGDEHCEDVGCLIVDNHCIRTVHAEQNAIFQAAKLGNSLIGAKSYITSPPCLNCAKSLVMSGINEIIYYNNYKKDPIAFKLLKNSNIKIMEINNEKF